MDKFNTLLLKGLKEQEKQLEKELRDIKNKISDIEIPNCEHVVLISYDLVDCWQCKVCDEVFILKNFNSLKGT